MSAQETYTPLVNQPNNDFRLVPSSRGVEKQIHALQVRFAALPLEQRRSLCQVEAWDPAERIPELTREVRVGVSALGSLLKRTEKDDALLRKELAALVKDHSKEAKQVDFIGADAYWMSLARLLLKGFDEFAEKHKVSADELDFKAIQAAYNDFF